ncbi:serine/threonine-protein kinase ATR [Aricia agestis]|uniref:serine/threonine-protein kinase ATR n=1 Tax=Aricia agestis TaxID=91739 RepID=UPI001C209822|nr:serine/threonine-protein kinase ATR [Aricia agestis]
MDDVTQDGPYTMWKMFNDLTLVLFNNLENAADGLDRLLSSILKLSEDYSEVLVPKAGSSKSPDSHYNSFNTWLLGRLFYVCSVKELHSIHLRSIEAQSKILHILCINRVSFNEAILAEYYQVLEKLVEYYKEFPEGKKREVILENFTPTLTTIQDMKLEPIYVQVNSIESLKTIIEITLELLAESIPPNLINTPHKNNYLEEKVFTPILYMLEDFDIDLKYTCFKFFINLIKNSNRVSIIRLHDCFPKTNKAFLTYTEAMVETIHILYEKYEINDVYLKKINLTLLELLQESDVTSIKGYEEIYASICTIVINNSTKIFTKDLKMRCLLLSKFIELPKSITDLQKKEASEIDMLKTFYVKQILPFVHNNIKLNILNENTYYNNALSVILNIKACEDMNLDEYLLSFHLSRCLSSLNILLSVHFECKSKDHSLLNKEKLMKIWTSLLKLTRSYKQVILGNKSVYKSILNVVICSICLNKNAAAEESEMFNQIVSLNISKSFLIDLQDTIRLCLLKYMLVKTLLLSKHRNKDSGSDTIMFVISSLMKSRVDCAKVVEVTPLLLSNKIMSASKIIGDILMPVFMSRIEDVQSNVISVLPAICCMSLADYVIIISNISAGHCIFEIGSMFLCILCSQCHNKNLKISEYIDEIKQKYDVICIENINSHTNSTQGTMKNLFGKFLNDKQHIKIGEKYWKLVECLLNHYFIFDYGVPSTIISEPHLKYIVQVFKAVLSNNQLEEDKSQDWNSKRESMINMCINLLVNSTQKSLLNNDVALQTQTLNYIKEFGLCRNSNLILPITKLLVYYIMFPQCPLNPKAIVFLRDVCEFHGQTPNQVYHKYKKDYCKLFVECSLYNGKEFPIYLLRVVRAFGFVGYRDFISKDGHHFLPYLILYAVSVKEVPSMIEEIAALVQCSVSDFLIERFPHIYVYVYLTQTNDMVQKCNSILENLTRCTVLNLIKRHFRVILTEFLLQYCSSPEKVLNAIRYLACHDPDVSTPNGSMTMSIGQIADFLNPKFLGVLAYFDHKLVNTKVALSVKRKALKSFPEILQLMGVKYLTPLRYKVLATLRTALPLAKEFPKILAEAWGAFIHNIDSISLGPLLSNLAVSLLQQIEYAPQEINKIFQYLVLSNENILSSHISDLFFIEDTKISERVKMVVKKHVTRTQPESFLDRVKWYLQHLNQDIPKIKAVAYNNLNRLLESNRSDIHKAIFGGKSIDPVVVELIDKLLDGCKDPDVSVSVASGLCLGQFGAIEAGHLPRRYVQPDGSPFAFSINDNCFAATALIELARAFQYEKDTSNMDCYALTIQEILKIYDISPSGSKKEVWESFPENMHQIMIPLLSSRYTLAYPFQPKKAHPLFGSVYATTFLEWAHNWAGQLIPLIESQSIRELLRTVHPSMRRDVRTLFLFLPYVLLHAVMSKNNMEYIHEEMLAVIGSETIADTALSGERQKLKILRHIRMTPNVHTVQAEDMNQSKCSKTVYTLLDFLNRWLLEWTNVKQRPLENGNYKNIKMFIEKFDKLKIARGNFECGELERALQYLELYMTEDKSRAQEQLSFLAEIYALLDEPDTVAGILSIKQTEPSVKELILAQVVTGRLQDAALCYERLAKEDQLDDHSLRGMIDCYLGLDQPFTAYRLLDELDTDMSELSAEPLWRLGRFEQLDELVKKPVPPSRENWGLLMGRVLIAYRKQEVTSFDEACSHAAASLVTQMHTDTRGESALRTTYHSVVGLHILAEAGHAMELLKRFKDMEDGSRRCEDLLNELLSEWRQRLSIVQSDVRTIEPLLRMRRILLQQMQEQLEPSHPMTSSNLKSCIGNLWLQSAKQARKAGNLQQSYMYILNAEEYKPDQLFIEKAKMYWARGQNEPAFTSLKRGLQDAFPNQNKLTRDESKIVAKAKLLIAKYNDETANVDVDVNIRFYKESVDVFKEWEKSLVCLGSYYEKVSGSADSAWTRRLHALNCYGKALQYGHRYLYRSMPRMLSIWLDVEVTSSDTSVHSVLAQMTEIIRVYSERLPLYLFLTAFSQIISRICHPVKEVYLQLKAILVSLLAAYPQHALWMSLSVLQSSYPARAKRAADVISSPRLREPHLMRLRDHFTRLATALIELCNKPIHTNGEITVSSLVRTLPKMLSGDFSHIMMPFQEFCKIVLPCKAASQERLDINIPVEPPVYIAGIEEKITILPSLQKPRKVTLRGSDGKAYIIMLKPRDDLRKDFRLMEFNTVVNRFLQDEPETRKRRLYIRTYSVLPLNEECGLIEWVPNLVGLRPVLLHIYKQKGIQTSNRELKDMMCSNKDPLEKKRLIYETQLLPRHPPVFHEWFRRVFADPCAWYQARSAYIRTTAVMSMVGYILGLGDRHGENISFDATNGDTVHVDFNCLFNKGEAFEWPERVPFRLTHNMCAAMGPLQYEGMYRKCCEAVMRALRAQTEALMSVVGPFVYDPLVSWGRGRPPPSAPPERTNDQALQHLAHIRQRLNGMVKLNNKQLSLSLSPEGQVEHLIVEATSIVNLCQMYIGWGPFL